MYGYNSDCLNLKGYINKETLLKYVTQEEIFEYVFGAYPEEYEYILSPFREDKSPRCFFSYDKEEILWFNDFADNRIINKIRCNKIDCFNAVQLKYHLPNFYQTLEFIKTKILKADKSINKVKSQVPKRIIKNSRSKIFINPTNFTKLDYDYWMQYGITLDQISKDKVFSISHFKIVHEFKENASFETSDLAYAYTDFKLNRIKIYRPNREKNLKFYTNCSKNDVGGWNLLPEKGPILIITKSYKDWRILTNNNVLSIWVQNEGMIPKEEIIVDLLQRFDNIYLLFDNDSPGVIASDKFIKYCNNFKINEVKQLFIPFIYSKYGITDCGDLVSKKAEIYLRQFLKENKVI